jgi:transposase
MNTGKTIFSQLIGLIPRHEFNKCVERYHGHYKVKDFSCWDQYLAMIYAQLTYRESLRDIQESLNAGQNKLYHMGFRGQVRRNTLANANAVRDWRIYQDFAHVLIAQAQKLYWEQEAEIDFQQMVYALDSTTIDLCLSLFPWAKFRKRKGAIKLHTLLDVQSQIPVCVTITPGKVHDVNILDEMFFEPAAIYVMDRGYVDFQRFFIIHQALAFFVTRAKSNIQFRRQESRPIEKGSGVLCDQIVMLRTRAARQDYPDKLRRIVYRDSLTTNTYEFITNNFRLPAVIMALLYKQRWQVELFFKWIKQHLRIKSFYGTNENAVKTQIWIAISTYILVAITKRRMALQPSLYTILQVLSVHLFEKTPIQQAFSGTDVQIHEDEFPKQLILFE